MQAITPATAEQVQQLVSAAVGASAQRGDQVTVIAGAFEPVEIEEPAFYETGWFDTALRYGTALLAVILGLLFGVRPIMKVLRGPRDDAGDAGNPPAIAAADGLAEIPLSPHAASARNTANDELKEQVALARRLANEQPERAVVALRRMLATPVQEAPR